MKNYNRPAFKRDRIFAFFDELGEEQVAERTVRQMARDISERLGQTVHQSTVADYRRLWQDHRDEIEREEKAWGERFSVDVIDDLWRWPVEARGYVFSAAGRINALVDHRAAEPPTGGVQPAPSKRYSVAAIVRANAWRFRDVDAVVVATIALELDELIERLNITEVPGPAVGDDPRDERMRAAHDALDQRLRLDGGWTDEAE